MAKEWAPSRIPKSKKKLATFKYWGVEFIKTSDGEYLVRIDKKVMKERMESGEFDRAIEEYKYELPFFPLL